MPTINELVQQCFRDTARIVGHGAANRLWRGWVSGQIEFVKNAIRTPEGWMNGRTINQRGGMSLERIIVEFYPEYFDRSDIDLARQTLGRR